MVSHTCVQYLCVYKYKHTCKSCAADAPPHPQGLEEDLLVADPTGSLRAAPVRAPCSHVQLLSPALQVGPLGQDSRGSFQASPRGSAGVTIPAHTSVLWALPP